MTTPTNNDKLVSSENDSRNSESLEFLRTKFENVVTFRDRYFENHSLDDAIHKDDEVKKFQQETLKLFEKIEADELNATHRAKLYLVKGALWNVVPEYSKEAENLLSKAIKLDRKLLDAWNELGDCYWKNNEFKKARSCFEGALNQERNKISLRNLSMLSRQEVFSNPAQRIANIEEGLKYATEAVALDPTDGLSWSCLGNASLCYFFQVQQNPKFLKQAISAYINAEKDVVARSLPELHYNKGIILKYNEEFKKALESFSESSRYDPTWDKPKQKTQHLIDYLNNIMELVTTKGKMKTKRFKKLLDSINSKHLGPYLEDTKNVVTGANARLIRANIKELKTGFNELKVLLGKVVCSIRNEDSVPFTFCLVDEMGECVVITIFNLAVGEGVIIGDSVAIPEPSVTDVDFEYNSVKYKFRLIRVETPLLVAVNGKLLQPNQIAGVEMSISRTLD